MKSNLNVVTRRLNKYLNKDIPAAQVTATNKVLAMAKTSVVRAVAVRMGVKNKYLKPRVYISRAKGGAKPKSAKLHFYRRGIPLIDVNAKQVEGGVVAGSYVIPGAFIADGSKGYGKGRLNRAHVLRRTTKKQYPLELIRVNIKKAVNEETPKTVSKIMRANFKRLYDHEIKRRSSRS